jgi:hypothetical protein
MQFLRQPLGRLAPFFLLWLLVLLGYISGSFWTLSALLSLSPISHVPTSLVVTCTLNNSDALAKSSILVNNISLDVLTETSMHGVYFNQYLAFAFNYLTLSRLFYVVIIFNT